MACYAAALGSQLISAVFVHTLEFALGLPAQFVMPPPSARLISAVFILTLEFKLLLVMPPPSAQLISAVSVFT